MERILLAALNLPAGSNWERKDSIELSTPM
jgi:hypothetical protein